MRRFVPILAVLSTLVLPAFPNNPQLPEEVTSEHNPGKRSEIALASADRLLDEARSHYKAGETQRGEEELDLIRRLADECFSSAQEAHKSKYWKKAEMRIAALSRRVHSLAEELDYTQREKANQLAEHLDHIRDKLLAGVMSK
jgi:hypothetical protein